MSGARGIIEAGNNSRPGKGGAGVCKRTGKNRDVGAKACGHFDPL
jgi:hypothetical protein